MSESEKIDRGQAILFYSFKGGVGRTFALANIAWILAGEGFCAATKRRRVLAIDFDLESPGLHYYFYQQDVPIQTEMKGLIDLLEDLKISDNARMIDESGDDSPRVDEVSQEFLDKLERIDLNEYVREVPDSQQTSRVDLWILPVSGSVTPPKAGTPRHRAYLDRIHNLDWAAIDKHMPWAIPLLVQKFTQQYDFVLIDARTGLSDISFQCSLIPDKIVFVFGLNRQGLNGSEAFFDRALAIRRKNAAKDISPFPMVIPLPSMVQEGRPVDVHTWLHNDSEGAAPFFKRILPPLPNVSWDAFLANHFIPYCVQYAFGESLPVLSEPGKSKWSIRQRLNEFASFLVTCDSEAAVSSLFDRDEIHRERQEIYSFTRAAAYVESLLQQGQVVRRIGEDHASDFVALTSALKYREDVGKRLVKIGKHIRFLVDRRDEDNWNEMWVKYALNRADAFIGDLVNLGSGNVRIRDMNEGIWLEDLWKQSQASIWTTNVSTVGQSFGRELNPKSIERQAAAVRGNSSASPPRPPIEVTRVFVIEDGDDVSKLAEIAAAQLMAGICVYFISRAVFAPFSITAKREFHSDDFMIVDDQFIYVTDLVNSESILDKGKNRGVSIQNGYEALVIARRLKREIGAAATKLEFKQPEDICKLIRQLQGQNT